MKLHFHDQRIMAVVAHPDDAELLCAGTLARAQADGAQTAICVMCQGDKGQPAARIANLAATRRKEMARAARLLGAQLLRADVPDSTLTDDPPTRRKLVGLMRRFRPTLVLAHWPHDYHTDHRAAGRLAEVATWLAASHGQKSRQRPLNRPPALWWMDTLSMQAFEPTLLIDVGPYVDLKRKMLRCHASQITRADDPQFTSLIDLMERQVRMRGTQAGVEAAEAFRPHLAFGRTRAW